MNLISLVLVVMLAAVSALFLGYATGRRIGFRQGHQRGIVEAPLRLRCQAQRVGRCPVCDHGASK